MQAPRVTRSSVLGKRGHHHDTPISLPAKSSDLPTPDSTPSPKRARTSLGYFDPDSNKENVPPLSVGLRSPEASPTSTRSARSLRRTTTELTTPSRTKPVRRHASTTTIIPITPTREVSQPSLATPPITPKILLPLHARAKALLRATCNDATATVTCRDVERDSITQFLQSFVNDEPSKRCMYISGSPGTGKTALLNHVLRSFDSRVCNVFFLNCMVLKNVDTLWEKLVEDLTATNVMPSKKTNIKKLKGRAAAEAAFASLTTKCILVLDELDHIAADPHTIESILSLPKSNPESLCLIGIANTHTLSSGTSSGIPIARDVLTVHFSPYTTAQLQDILRTRLSELYSEDQDSTNSGMAAFLPPSSLTLLTKKIAAMTGDVRSLFEVLRGAINLAVSSSAAEENPLSHSPKVTPAIILQALKSHVTSSNNTSNKHVASISLATGNSEIVAKINRLNLQARVILLSVLLAAKRFEAGLALTSAAISLKKAPALKRSSSTNCSRQTCIDTTQLHSYYCAALLRSDAACLNVASKSEFGDLLVILEGSGLVSSSASQSTLSGAGTRQGKRTFGRSASFNGLSKNLATSAIRLAEGIWVEEVLRGLGIANPVEDDVVQSEIRGIWERETARMERETKNAKSDLN